MADDERRLIKRILAAAVSEILCRAAAAYTRRSCPLLNPTPGCTPLRSAPDSATARCAARMERRCAKLKIVFLQERCSITAITQSCLANGGSTTGRNTAPGNTAAVARGNTMCRCPGQQNTVISPPSLPHSVISPPSSPTPSSLPRSSPVHHPLYDSVPYTTRQ
ncbi:unnamed protein product, partial [Gadus morhua 'NCC']